MRRARTPEDWHKAISHDEEGRYAGRISHGNLSMGTFQVFDRFAFHHKSILHEKVESVTADSFPGRAVMITIFPTAC